VHDPVACRTTSADYWCCRIAGRGGRFDRRIDRFDTSGTGNDLGRNGFRPMAWMCPRT